MDGLRIIKFVYSQPFLVGLLGGFYIALLFIDSKHAPLCRSESVILRKTQKLVVERLPQTSIRPPQTYSLSAVGLASIVKRNRIFCWVVTHPKNKVKAEMVKNTWGQRCDKLLFMSSQNGIVIPAHYSFSQMPIDWISSFKFRHFIAGYWLSCRRRI